jgi:hypothetical protein
VSVAAPCAYGSLCLRRSPHHTGSSPSSLKSAQCLTARGTQDDRRTVCRAAPPRTHASAPAVLAHAKPAGGRLLAPALVDWLEGSRRRVCRGCQRDAGGLDWHVYCLHSSRCSCHRGRRWRCNDAGVVNARTGFVLWLKGLPAKGLLTARPCRACHRHLVASASCACKMCV